MFAQIVVGRFLVQSAVRDLKGGHCSAIIGSLVSASDLLSYGISSRDNSPILLK